MMETSEPIWGHPPPLGEEIHLLVAKTENLFLSFHLYTLFLACCLPKHALGLLKLLVVEEWRSLGELRL